MKLYFLLICFIFNLSSFQCENQSKAKQSLIVDNILERAVLKPIQSQPYINYYHISLKKDSIVWLNPKTSDDTLNVLMYLNRVDKLHLFRLDTIVVPDTFINDIMAYGPFPDSMDSFRQINKLILFSYPVQAFAVYENGTLTRWGPVSMGKESTTTPTGLFHTNWRSKRAISTINSDWIMNWYFNLDNLRGVSMHEYDLPGYPASHACVRMTKEDAFWLYNWADSWILFTPQEIGAYGTPIIIYGCYPFEQRKPWLNLAQNNKALEIAEEELLGQVREYLPLIMERQIQRDSLILLRKNKLSLK